MSSFFSTTLQSMMSTKPNSVSKSFDTAMKTGSTRQQMIPHNQYVSVKLTSLYCGSRLILVYLNPQKREAGLTFTYVEYRSKRLDEPVVMAVPKPMLTEFGIHNRLEGCDQFFRPRTPKMLSMWTKSCLFWVTRSKRWIPS